MHQSDSFKQFFFDSNIWSGWILNQSQLNELITRLANSWRKSVDYVKQQILDSKSCVLHSDHNNWFGLYAEYTGQITLKEYLEIK